MPTFSFQIHKNERLNLSEGFGRQVATATQVLSGPSVSIWSGVLATKNTTTDFTISNVAVATTAVTGHDDVVHPANQAVLFTLAPKGTVTGGRYISVVRVRILNTTEVLVQRTNLFVDTKGAT